MKKVSVIAMACQRRGRPPKHGRAGRGREGEDERASARGERGTGRWNLFVVEVAASGEVARDVAVEEFELPILFHTRKRVLDVQLPLPT